MVIAGDHVDDVLLQGMSSGSPIDDMWYINMGAGSHMTGIKIYYQSLDESHKGVVRFGDSSSIRYEDKGEVHVDCTNGERIIFKNVLFNPKLKTNNKKYPLWRSLILKVPFYATAMLLHHSFRDGFLM